MIQFKALLIKELKETFRDKRALAVAMLLAFMAPVMIFALSQMMIKKTVETPPAYIKITGAEHAPELIKAFNKENILLFTDAPSDLSAIWDERNIELTIPESYNEDMLAGKTVELILRADYSNESTGRPIRRIKDVVWDYSQALGFQRLMLRGIDARLLRPIRITQQDTATPNSSPVAITMILGMYLLMAAFMSSLSISIDSSAGERERNVLELLLSQPVSTLKIIMAKLINSSMVGIIGVTLTLTLTTIALGFVDLTKIGASFQLDTKLIFVLLLLLVPICLFASALQLFVSFQSKSFKEAQSTASVVILIPAMTPVALMFIEDRPQWLDWVPIVGHSLLMEDLFKGIPINWSILAFTGLVTLGITLAMVFAMSQRLKSEKAVLALN